MVRIPRPTLRPRATRGASTALVCLSAASTAAALLVASAAPAVAMADGTSPSYPGSSVHVTISGPKTAGKLFDIVATGSNQKTSLGTPIDYGLYVILVNQKLLPGPCASSFETELNNISADQGAGRQLNYAQYSEGESGSFTIKVPYTPAGGGRLLVCAYSEYVTDDAAWGSTTAVISGQGASSAGGAPKNTGRPHVTRHGDSLTCARGSWSGHPASYSFRWRLAGRTSTQRRNTLTLPANAHGTAVCTVTARNAVGSRSASSRPLTV